SAGNFRSAPANGHRQNAPGPLCSSASQLLWQSLTSRDRASSATAPRLPDADRRLLPNGRSRDLPVLAQGTSALLWSRDALRQPTNFALPSAATIFSRASLASRSVR